MGDAAKGTDGCQEWGALGLALREILGSTSHAIVTTDREHRIVGWNEQAERLYGYSEDEVAGKSILDILAVRCRRKKAARVSQILQRGECFSGELRILTKAGKSVPAHTCFKALRDKLGQEVGYMGILIDLSTFRDREKNLRSKNRSLRAFTQVALSLCSPMRTKETLQHAVRSIVKVFSGEAGAIFLRDGKSATFAPFVHEGTPEAILEEMASYNDARHFSARIASAGKGLLIRDTRARSKEGWVVPATIGAGFRSLIGVPLLGQDGVLGTIELASRKPNRFTAADLRLLETLAFQVAGAVDNGLLREKLEKALSAKERQASEARHRLTNSLQAVACLLLTSVRDGEWTEKEKEVIESAVRRISAMAAIQHQMVANGAESMDLTEAMKRMEFCLREMYGDRHEITFRTAATRVSVPASWAASLAMAINELVWNSCCHGFDPGQVGSVAVNTFVKNGTLEIEVRDNGKGIPANFALDRDANTGLAIVRNLVERDLSGSFSLRRENGTVAAMHCQIH